LISGDEGNYLVRKSEKSGSPKVENDHITGIYLYLIMPDNSQTTPEIIEEAPEQFKFPVSHFIVGLVLSCISFFVLLCIEGGISSTSYSPGNGFSNSDLPPVLRAFLIPELLIVGTLIWLANRSQKAGNREYKASYNTLIVVNIICFCLVCMIMGSIEC